jgi:F0F1-type ATP synthase epsilon subunit
MKKLITTTCIAIGFLMPMAMNSTLRADPYEHEHHPEIHEALHALERARDHLQHANHDFGGHREEALRACDHAIEQLRLALQFDRH